MDSKITKFLLVLCLLCGGHAQTTENPNVCAWDICVAIDRSHTIDSTEWTQMLEHVAGMIDIIASHIDGGDIRMGLVSFDEISTLDIKLDAHTSAASLKAAILSQPHSGNGRDISLGLFRMRYECFKLLNGDRQDVHNLAVLITDGRSNYDKAIQEADLLRYKVEYIVTVGVDSTYLVEDDLLQGISASPDLVHTLGDFVQLKQTPYLYLKHICPNMVHFPVLNGPPVLSTHKQGNSDFYFNCTVNYTPDQNAEAIHQIRYQFDGTDVAEFPAMNVTTVEEIPSLPGSYLEGHMGSFVGCVVVSTWSTGNNFPSPPVSSNQQFTGVQLDFTYVTISEVDETDMDGYPLIGKLTLHTTIPIVCPDGPDPCQLVMDLDVNSRVTMQQHSGADPCSLILSPEDWTGISTEAGHASAGKVLNIQPKRISVATESLETFTLAMTIRSPSPLWAGYQPEIITIDVAGAQARGLCQATTDPNIVTFDDAYISMNNNPGSYLMLRNPGESFFIEIYMEESRPEYICAVAIKSGTERYPGGPTGETIIFDMCDGSLDILRCHPEDQSLVTRDGSEYTVLNRDGDVTVTIYDRGSWLNVYVSVPANYKRGTECLCGDFNGNSGNDIFDPNCRVVDEEASYFTCQDTYPVIPSETVMSYCQCEGSPLCQLGDQAEGSHPVDATEIVNDGGSYRKSSQTDDSEYSDDIIDDYQPPMPYTGPIVSPSKPPWGTYNVTESQAEEACLLSLTGSSSYGICNDHVTDNTTQIHVTICKSDIQITGDLGWAQEHVAGFQETCQATIQRSINVTDPENPNDDPAYKEIMDAFLNTTCPSNCSGHGVCNRSICLCNTGYIGDDCALDANTPPSPTSYSGPVVCDVEFQPCTSIKIQATNLVYSELLSCRINMNMSDGISTTFEDHGQLYTTQTIKCPLRDLHTLGNTSSPAAYNYSVSVSNNQVNYAELQTDTPQMVWNSDWVFRQCVEEGKMIPKGDSCVIEEQCKAEGDMLDACNGCHPDKDPHNWTPAEEIDEDTNLSTWSNYSTCTKDCDYGMTKRTRECTGGCCGYGELSQSVLCNTDNCPELEGELKEGVIISITSSPIEEIVMRELELIQISTNLLNEHNAENPTAFCQALQMEVKPNPSDPASALTQNDTRTAQGYPIDNGGGVINIKLITEVLLSSVDSVCEVRAKRDTSQEKRTLESAYMMTALAGLENALKQEWNEDITVTLTDPDPDPDDVSEVNVTLIIAIVFPIAVVLIVLGVILGVVMYKKKEKERETERVEHDYRESNNRTPSFIKSNRVSPEPPRYDIE